MSDCRDCAVLSQRLAVRAKNESRLLAELEAARDRLATHSVGRSTPSVDEDRHWQRVICDRCGAAITLSMTLAVNETQHGIAMLGAAIALGWHLSRVTETLLRIGGKPEPKLQDDLCPACVRATGDKP